jgi:UDP-3-O-[3-hydroxymyristoyl] glucosamine N-acyltransferase
MIKTTNIALIGFADAVFVRDLTNLLSDPSRHIVVIEPTQFLTMSEPQHQGYLICVNRDMSLRKQLVDHLETHKFPEFTYVHPSAIVLPDCKIGSGTFIGPFCFLASKAVVEDHCIVSPYSMISHLSAIGKGTVIQPGTIIAGTVNVGKYCKFNLKASVIDNIDIADNTEIAAVSTITKPVTEPNGFYVGTPARRAAT